MAALNDCPACHAGKWHISVVPEGEGAFIVVTLYRICTHCGYTESRCKETDWERWGKAKEDPDE